MKAFYFIAIIAMILAVFTSSVTAQDTTDYVELMFNSPLPLAQVNMTELVNLEAGGLFELFKYAMQRTKEFDVYALSKADLPRSGASNFDLGLMVGFTLKNSQKDTKADIVKLINDNATMMVFALNMALVNTDYSINSVKAAVVKVPNTCIVKREEPFTDEDEIIGYHCGTVDGRNCAMFLCLPHSRCNADAECISGSCRATPEDKTVKRCAAIPQPISH